MSGNLVFAGLLTIFVELLTVLHEKNFRLKFFNQILTGNVFDNLKTGCFLIDTNY